MYGENCLPTYYTFLLTSGAECREVAKMCRPRGNIDINEILIHGSVKLYF